MDSQNDAGYTALHHAAKHGSKELIEILVKAGADRLIENNAGETPYMVARKFEQLEAERLLLNVEQQHGGWVGGIIVHVMLHISIFIVGAILIVIYERL